MFEKFYCLFEKDGFVYLHRDGSIIPVTKILLDDHTVFYRNADRYFISPFYVLRLSNCPDLVYPFLSTYDLFNRLNNFSRSGKSGIQIQHLIPEFNVQYRV